MAKNRYATPGQRNAVPGEERQRHGNALGGYGIG